MNQPIFIPTEAQAHTALFLAAFQQYRKAFEEQPVQKRPEEVKAPSIPLHKTFFTAAHGWGDAAQALLSSMLTNEVNFFGEGLRKLRAWKEVLETFTNKEQQIALILEFVAPLATQLISFPYALKNRFTFVAMRLSDEANRILKQNLDLKPTSNESWMTNLEHAWKYIEKPWGSQKNIKKHFNNIFPDEKERESRVYKARGRWNHTRGVYIGVGILSSVTPQPCQPHGGFFYTEEAPLSLDEINTELLPLHQACCIAHKEMKNLAERQQQEIFQRLGIAEKNE